MTPLSDAVERVRDHLGIYAHHMNPQRLADLTLILAALEARTERAKQLLVVLLDHQGDDHFEDHHDDECPLCVAYSVLCLTLEEPTI